MPSLSVRLMELGDDELEQFIELWIERKSKEYVRVERIGAANDKGRDVIGFLSPQRHEGPWHLYQCKRKTRGGKLGVPEAMVELGKMFHHHLEGAYQTLPTKYVFVSPRGVVGPLMDLINNPSKLKDYLISTWDKHCVERITSRETITLTPTLLSAIEAFDFSRVEQMTAPMIVKDSAAGPALTKLLGVSPGEAPPGVTPSAIQAEELEYLEQLRQVYEEAAGTVFATADDVLAHPDHGNHLTDQRTRFFEAASFRRFHRDNTAPDALQSFENDIYHGVIEVHREPHSKKLDRVNAVMKHAGVIQVGLLRSMTRVPVRQGMCHHLANEGRLTWTP